MIERKQLEQELHAARHSAAVIDVSSRSQFEIAGADRHAFLHNFCTHDIKALLVGAGCEAIFCNIKGRILGHAFVFAGPSSLWVETAPQQAAPLLAHMRRYLLLEDAKLTDQSESFGELLVVGPSAHEQLARLDGVPSLTNWHHASVTLNKLEAAVWIKRADLFDAPSYWLSAKRELIPALRDLLMDQGVVSASAAAFETLRVEAALPYYGIDLSDENLAQEANRTQQAISFTKGCYLGQEPIARLHAMGHVNKELKRFEVEGKGADSLASGTALLSPDDSAKEIGRLTSLAWSPTREKWIALGIVRSAFSPSGTQLPIAGQAHARARVM